MNNLPSPRTTKAKKIVGRGPGSKKGAHSTGRGNNGQKSRSGYSSPRPDFEGGQVPFSRRLPQRRGMYGSGNRTRKRGFITSKRILISLPLSKLAVFKSGDTVSIETLVNAGLINPKSHKDTHVKIVFDKSLDFPLNIKDLPVTARVRESVISLGGNID